MRTLIVAALVVAGCGGSGEPSQVIYIMPGSTSTGGEGGAGGATTSSSASTESGGGGGTGGVATSSASSSTTTSISSSSSSSSTTTTIAPPECVLAMDCPGVDSECRSRTCVAGVCDVDLAAEGVVLTSQVEGDCAVRACDGTGAVVSQVDPSDHGDSGSECIVDACGPGGATHTERPIGTSCTQGGGHLCKEGKCVEYIPVRCYVPGDGVYIGCDGQHPVDQVGTYDTSCWSKDIWTYCAPGDYCDVFPKWQPPRLKGTCL